MLFFMAVFILILGYFKLRSIGWIPPITTPEVMLRTMGHTWTKALCNIEKAVVKRGIR